MSYYFISYRMGRSMRGIMYFGGCSWANAYNHEDSTLKPSTCRGPTYAEIHAYGL